MSIPKEAFDFINKELARKPLLPSDVKTTKGKSLTFGIVAKRSAQPDYSRQNWLRPLLYKALLEFASKYVSIPYSSIAITYNKKPTIDGSFQVSFDTNYYLTYYTLEGAPELPPPSVVQLGNKHFFKRGDVIIRDGHPHPKTQGKAKGITREYGAVSVSFT